MTNAVSDRGAKFNSHTLTSPEITPAPKIKLVDVQEVFRCSQLGQI